MVGRRVGLSGLAGVTPKFGFGWSNAPDIEGESGGPGSSAPGRPGSYNVNDEPGDYPGPVEPANRFQRGLERTLGRWQPALRMARRGRLEFGEPTAVDPREVGAAEGAMEVAVTPEHGRWSSAIRTTTPQDAAVLERLRAIDARGEARRRLGRLARA